MTQIDKKNFLELFFWTLTFESFIKRIQDDWVTVRKKVIDNFIDDLWFWISDDEEDTWDAWGDHEDSVKEWLPKNQMMSIQ